MVEPTCRRPGRSRALIVCAALSAPAQAADVWTQAHPAPPVPPAPFGGAIVDNDAHGLVLITGATSLPFAESAFRFDGADWTRLPASTSPVDLQKRTRFAASGATGLPHSIIFGGVRGAEYFNDTIRFDGATFTRLNTPIAPSPRADSAMAQNPDFGLILFGGRGPDGLLGDTWHWNGISWTLLTQDSPTPSPRARHAMAYDPVRDIIVLYGGETADGLSNETWTFDDRGWVRFTYLGPSPRAGHSMFFDEGRGRVVLVGGLPQNPDEPVAETWEWTGTNWARFVEDGPTPRTGAAAGYDARRGVGVLFGGVSAQASLLNDTWQFVLPPPLNPEPPIPVGLRPTSLAAGFFDEDQFPDAVVVDGDRNSVFVFRNRGVDTPSGLRGASPDDAWLGFESIEEIPLGASPTKVVAHDITGDGKTDLVITTANGATSNAQVLSGRGNGGFNSSQPIGDETFGQDDIQPGDIDNTKDRGANVWTDLVSVSAEAGRIAVYPGTTGGYLDTITLDVGGRPTAVALVDLDGDGFGDLVWTDAQAGTVAVILQQLEGDQFPLEARRDFVVGPAMVVRGTTFSAEPVDLVVLDFDGDERLDIATADRATSTVTALRNRGVDGDWLGLHVTDVSPSGAEPVSIETGYFFGSGRPDLATADRTGSTISLLRNVGRGFFADPVKLIPAAGPIALARADLNADGLTDLLAASAPPSPPGVLSTFLNPGPGPCPGDATGDRAVGFEDLMVCLSTFGYEEPPLAADFDHSGVVDFFDLNTVLSAFGTSCP